jgi:hypothetical protein
MVVTLSVDAGSTLATQQLQFKLSCVGRSEVEAVVCCVLCVCAVCGSAALRRRTAAACGKRRRRRAQSLAAAALCVLLRSKRNLPPNQTKTKKNSKDGVCPCGCDYASDRDCACRDLARELTVTLVKSRAMASYPLTYLQSFNYKPVEGVVRPGPGRCRDGAYDAAPTCGWYYAGGGKIADSQGFCCACDAKQVWDDTFGAASRQRTCVFLWGFVRVCECV